MQLLCARIQGFRRFAEEASVRLTEPLIAFVGPNEAGKTSVLEAFMAFESGEPIQTRDATRRAEVSPTVELLFELDDDDQEAIAGVRLPLTVKRCRFRKASKGSVDVFLEPAPAYSGSARATALEALARVPKLLDQRAKQAKDLHRRKAQVQRVIKDLEGAADCLTADEIAEIEALAGYLRTLVTNRRPAKGQDPIEAAAASLKAVKQEEESSAGFQARAILGERRPRFVLFDADSRELRSSYEIAAVAKQPPRALFNLACLAGLNLKRLALAVSKSERDHIREIIDAANARLEESFERAWNHPGVVPALDDDGTSLFLLVRTTGRAGLSSFDERSDGLRWFIALLAFLHGHSDHPRPILLVDEAERHLSYDAQANLVTVLETQRLAQQVIYTTHSAGCLPSDLGTGVRPVIPVTGKGERSHISNAFWTNEPGFHPLFMAMGLGPLAFTPARNVVIGEGPSECILLPSLLREATGRRQLCFQVAPGASQTSSGNFRQMLSEGGCVAFVLDGDDSGLKIKEFLIAAGASEEQIWTYEDVFRLPVVLEDLVLPEAYAEAFNAELARWQQSAEQLDPAQLPAIGRAAWVDSWCTERRLEKVTKATLCQRLAEEAVSGRRLLSQAAAEKLMQLHTAVERYFEQMEA